MFQLHSDYKPTGDQPQAIQALTDGLEKGYRHQDAKRQAMLKASRKE